MLQSAMIGARVGEQRVVGVHHALGLAGGARREGEIDDLVGVGFDLRRCEGPKADEAISFPTFEIASLRSQ